MKHKFLRKLIAISVVTSTLITTLSPIEASAAWAKNDYGNWIYTEGYSYATGWREVSHIWYFFDNNGEMKTGWVQNNGQWYYMDLSGAMQVGVMQIEGKTYLFSPYGAMQKGKCIINKEFYDFDDNGVFIGTNYPAVDKGFDYYGKSTMIIVPSQVVTENASMSSDIPSDGSIQVAQYKVKFEDPDADVELLKTRTVDEDTKMMLYKPTKTGYNFTGWNTKSDGDGTNYDYDDSIKVTKDITLYAQWEVESVTDSTAGNIVKVQKIVVSSQSGETTITAAGGTLRMAKKVSPSEADNQKVDWTISNGTGEATIDTNGIVTAVSDGTVTVIATAKDGSAVSGKMVITISGNK